MTPAAPAKFPSPSPDTRSTGATRFDRFHFAFAPGCVAPLRQSTAAQAKTAGFKGDAYFGVITGSGANLVFNLARADGHKEAPVQDPALKKFLDEKADWKGMPTFAIVETLPAIPFDEDDLKQPLIAKFVGLGDAIARFLDAQPARAKELTALVNGIRELLQDRNFEAAGPKLESLGQLLQAPPMPGTVVGEPVPPTSPPASPPKGSAADVEKLLAKLKPECDVMIQNSVGAVTAIQAGLAAALEKSATQDYAGALVACQQLAARLQDEWKRQAGEVLPRVKRLLESSFAEQGGDVSKIRALVGLAQERAGGERFGSAAVVAARLATLLDAAESTTAPREGEVIPEGKVDEARVQLAAKFDKSQLAWRKTRERLEQDLAALEDAIVGLYSTHPLLDQVEAKSKQLYDVLDDLDDRLSAKLAVAAKASEREQDVLHQEALEIVAEYRQTAANNYLQHHAQKYNNNRKLAKAERDPAEKFRMQTCEEALANVKRLRAASGLSLANLGPPPWDENQERRARQMEATLLVRNNGAIPLPQDEKGASESFFLANEKNEKQFIFKPMDGEFSPNEDWPAGGGAPREVMLGRISETLNKSLGLDTGVSPTSLVKLDSPSLDTGGGSVRIGAVQNFVPSVPFREANLDLVEDENVQGIALLDFVTLQMDRNEGNLLVKGDPETKPELVPIDAGFSLPTAKAFQSGQGLFGSNQIFTMPGVDKPFTPELLEKIRQLDPNQIVQTMVKTNQEMRQVDPNAGQMINDESIDLAKRSTLFLKAIADKLTVREIGVEAYGKHFHRLLPPVDVQDFDKIIPVILADINEEKRQWQELQNRKYLEELFHLGWPNVGEFTSKNPSRLLEIVKHGIEHPGTLRKIEALYDELEGRTYDELGFDPRKLKCAARHKALLELKDQRATDALRSRPELMEEAQRQNIDLDSLNATMQLKTLKDLDEYLNLGGNQRLTEVGQFDPNVAFSRRLAAIRNLEWQIEFEKLGGEVELTRRRQTGLQFPDSNIEFKVRALKQFAELDRLGGTDEIQRRQQTNIYFPASSVGDAVSSLNMWVEYDQAGGEDEYKRRGGPETQATNDLWNRSKWLEELLSLE